jgi:beta-N-acetylhexosaminidase
MSLREKIGQMLVLGFSGDVIDEHHPLVKWITEDNLGGVILFDYDIPSKQFGKNLKSTEQIKQLTTELNQYAKGLPLLIAVDYEGGEVNRLSRIDGCMPTMKPSEQVLLSDEALYAEASRMAQTLHELGFNLNFAPVVDLNLNEEQGIIGKLGRSFSADPQTVIHAAQLFVKAFADRGIACCYKHFPGHGSAVGDTHEGFVDVTETYQAEEIVPYEQLLKKAALPSTMVMTAHVINRHLDSQGLPATLSYPILTQLLRERIGFEGIVISDDLQMYAISRQYSLKDALRLTINAGADMLIFGNQLGSHTATEVIDCIEELVGSGDVAMSRIDEAYQRIADFKKTLNT